MDEISGRIQEVSAQTTSELTELNMDMKTVRQSIESARAEIMASVGNVYNELEIITENTKGLGTLSSEMKESISIFKVAE